VQAEDEVKRLNDEDLLVEHLLLAMLDDGGATGRLLKELGLTRERLMQALQGVRGGQRVTSPTPEATYEALARYGHDLTQLASQRKLDPVIGRDEEIRRVMQLEIEREALKKETDPASQARLSKLEHELAELKAQADELKARWQMEKEAVQRLRALREQIEQAERRYDLNRAAELRYGQLAGLERHLHAAEEELTRQQGQTRLLKEEVDEEDIAQVVSRWTGIPVAKLLEGEIQKLLHLEEELHRRVVGQDEAVTAVAVRGWPSATSRWS
jgi:ATP-dependent Clp protease ATP-binding subunit ClpA